MQVKQLEYFEGYLSKEEEKEEEEEEKKGERREKRGEMLEYKQETRMLLFGDSWQNKGHESLLTIVKALPILAVVARDNKYGILFVTLCLTHRSTTTPLKINTMESFITAAEPMVDIAIILILRL